MARLTLPLSLSLLAACIRPPEIVLVDRATALEQQAAGSFRELEKRLARAAMAPRPAPLTPEDLATMGMQPPPLVDTTELTQADKVDDLLKRRCVGEGSDGKLVRTRESCQGATDRAEVLALVERVNQARQQLWRWMHERRLDAPLDEVRRAWRAEHYRGLVCGGWWQRGDGGWEAKAC
jgi:uncharacterized protein YdbL (DUF1318 family)